MAVERNTGCLKPSKQRCWWEHCKWGEVPFPSLECWEGTEAAPRPQISVLEFLLIPDGRKVEQGLFAVDTKLGRVVWGSWKNQGETSNCKGAEAWVERREVQSGAVLPLEITQSSHGNLPQQPQQAVNGKPLAHEGFLLIN